MTHKVTSALALILSVLALVYAWMISHRLEAALGNPSRDQTSEMESAKNGSSELNNSPPSYIGNVYADKSGMDGLKIRIRLRDAKEGETASDGVLTIIVADEKGQLLTKRYQVRSADFKVEEYYMHDRLMFSLPRVTFSEFSRLPTSEYGKIEVVFETSEGRRLLGANDLVTLRGQ
jgi:hypothetical protein